MDGHIDDWVEANGLGKDILGEIQELSFENKEWPENKITSADWETLLKRCPKLVGFGCVECNIVAVEPPKDAYSGIEVLDFTDNKLANLDFLKLFPDVLSFCALGEKQRFESMEAFDSLKGLKALKFVEVEPPAEFKEKEEDFRTKIFDACGEQLYGVNKKTADGTLLDDEEEEEEGDFWNQMGEHLDEEELAALDAMTKEEQQAFLEAKFSGGLEEEFDEEDEEDAEALEVDEEDEDGDEEPPAKRAKTEE